MALLAGSPAIDAGDTALAVDAQRNPLTTDQRGTGFARTLNGMVDIGAFEDQISGTAPGSQNATQGVPGAFTLGSFSDQATPATAWSVDVNWGDGSTDTAISPTSQGSLGNAGHTYNTSGAKTVTVTVSDSHGDVGQYSFSVNVQPALTSIAVTPASPSVAKGLTQQFTATGTYTDGSTANLTASVTWASATPSVATISSTGLAQSLATGTTNITAALGSVTSPIDTLTVNADSTSTAVSSSVNPSAFGQSVTFTATVTNTSVNGSGTPTGSVQFVIDGSNFGSAVALVNGSASISDAALNVNGSPHTVSVTYTNSDGNYTGSTSPNFSQTVNADSTSTAVSSSVNPSAFGQSVTFTAAVSNTSANGVGTPTGSVQFVIDGSNFGSAVALVNGSASISDAALNVNGSPHTVSVTYTNSDGNFTGSTGTLTNGQTVNADSTSTAVSSSVNPSAFGQSVTFTATVTNISVNGSGTPTGSVQFVIDGSNFGSAVALVNGSASISDAALNVNGSPHTITAVYTDSDGNFTGSTGTLTNGQRVNQNQTTTSVSVSTEYLIDNQAVPLGQKVTLAATVTANESTVAPTGLVDFFDGPTKLDTVTLSHGTATLSTTMLVVGDHTIRADYHGDGANFAGSTSNRVISISTINKVAGGGKNDADGVLATSARLYEPTGVAVDASGNLFIADTLKNRVRMVHAGMIYTVAGGGETTDFGVNGVPATSARLNEPTGVAVDASGNLFIADTGNNRICEVSPDGRNGYLSGIITLFAGGGTADFGVNGIPATSARLNAPTGVAVDASGNLFIADTGSNRICEVSRDGSITLFAGGGETMDFGGGVPATSARLNAPTGVAVDAFGNLFIADTGNNRICKVDGDPMIITVAGGLDAPTGVAADRSGNVVFVDSREIGQLIPKGNPSDPRTIYQIITVAPRQTFNRDGRYRIHTCRHRGGPLWQDLRRRSRQQPDLPDHECCAARGSSDGRGRGAESAPSE